MFRLFVSRTTRRRPRNVTPQLETLEQVLSLSIWGLESATGTAILPVVSIPIVVYDPAAEVVLHGHLNGTYSAQTYAGPAGTVFNLSGVGQVRPLGTTNVTANLSSGGNISSNSAGGTVTLSASGGTLTLELKGQVQPGLTSLPNYFNYTVTGGTGIFSSATGHGKAFLELKPATTTIPLLQQGNFNLRLEGTA